jgi:hypothetical protein
VRYALLKVSDNRVCRTFGHRKTGLLRTLLRAKTLLCSLFVPFPKVSQSDSDESLADASGDITAG